MYILISSFLLLFTTIVQCQNPMVNPSNTNIGTCSCDLKRGLCDVSCCCDTDCSAKDMKRFNCDSKANGETNTISSKSTVQSTCFKDIPIYKSNSPYIVQKKGDLVCVDYAQDIDTDSAKYQQLINSKIDSSALPRSMNINNSVPSPLGTPINLTLYEAGSSVFRFISTTNTTTYYSLPIELFNSQICSGLQPITYMNDFTSTCNQPVTEQTCATALDTTKYINQFCLITNISALADTAYPSHICCSGSGSASSWSSPTCLNALQTLTMTIYYLNPNGIVNCTISLNSTNGTLNGVVSQTFTVRFVQSGSTLSTTSRSGNPGYLQGAPIIAGTSNGNSIAISDFTTIQASATGYCSGTNRIPIRFGQNIQSICLFSSTNSNICPNIANLPNIFIPYASSALYVAAYGNPDPSNITGYWLPVTYCTSEIGSSNEPVCQTSSIPSPSANQCYIRLDIQIVYANVGSVTNPQPILGAVIFNFQRISITASTTMATPLLITQSVTFQDISNAPATEGNLIPRPNTRLPGDFFYPFTLNQATISIGFSSCFYLLITFVFILM